MNVSILENEDFTKKFEDYWNKLQNSKASFLDIADWWDEVAKPGVKLFCQGFSTMLAKGRRDTKSFLYDCLDVSTKNKDWDSVTLIRNKITKIYLKEQTGVIIRSKFNQNLEEERASLYHANREKKHGTKNNVEELKVNGQVIQDKVKIAEEVLGFFYPLFNGHHSANGVNTGTPFKQDFSYLQEFLIPLSKLDNATRESLEEPFVMDELEEAIKDSKSTKSPGLDGIPYEWYKKCYADIKEDLLKIFNSILDRLKLTKSQEQGATRLLSKILGIDKYDM